MHIFRDGWKTFQHDGHFLADNYVSCTKLKWTQLAVRNYETCNLLLNKGTKPNLRNMYLTKNNDV